MTFTTELTDLTDTARFRREAERVMSVPLGLANPFWILFGAAATAGLTWWWMSRLARSADLDAMARESASIYEMAEATATTAPPAAKRARKIRIDSVDPGPDVAQAETMFETPDAAGYPRVILEPTVPPQARMAVHESEIPSEASETAAQAGYPLVAPGPEAADAADDLTQLTGVGPRIAEGLARHGVTRFFQLAAWTPEQLAAFDEAMKLRGRATRSDWIAQARTLANQA